LRVDVLALLDAGDHPIRAFFPIELVNNQSLEAEQGSGGASLLDVLIQRFKFLRLGLQVIIFIHQHVDRVAVSMALYLPVDPAHKPVVLLHRHSLGLDFNGDFNGTHSLFRGAGIVDSWAISSTTREGSNFTESKVCVPDGTKLRELIKDNQSLRPAVCLGSRISAC
jgi:hypothetical protein